MDKYKLKIKDIRKRKGLTQKEVALKSGISQNFLSEIENQKYDISLSLLWRIGHALDECPHNLVIYDCDINCSFYCKQKPP